MAETQPLHLVATERHHQGAVLAKIDAAAGLRLTCRAKLRPLPLAFEGEREEIVAPRFVLGGGCQHAGGRKARPGARGGALEDRHRKAAQCEPPCNR
jgi:hypothetical protein